MTDDLTTTPPLPPEELASAYVDGELSAAEREAVEADAALMALVDVHRQVRAAVGSPTVALTDTERDDLVAAAVAAAAAEGEGGVASLASHRERRSRRWLGAAAGAMAAAAVVALALVVSRPGDGGDDTATDRDAGALEATAGGDDTVASDTVAGAGQSATTAAAAEEAAPAGAPPSAPADEAPAGGGAIDEAAAAAALAALEDLGPLADRPAFIEAVRRFASTTPPAGPSPCPDYPPPLATATFRGTPAFLVVIEADPAGNRLALVDTQTCASLVKVDLASQ